MNLHPQIKECLARYPQLVSCGQSMQEALNILICVFTGNQKLLICGNGGSAADSDHIAGELMKGFMKNRPLPSSIAQLIGSEIASNLQCGFPAIPLPNLSGINTAYANDCNPSYIYAQSTFVLGQKGDALLCISTSGSSKNVLLAAQVAKAKGMFVIGLTGQNGKALSCLCNTCIMVPETIVYKIQELHLPIYHALCMGIEDTFYST